MLAKIRDEMEDRDLSVAPITFGALLRHHRLAAGLSQEALAELARVSTDGISALERGYRKTPQRETLALLASALGLTEQQRRDFAASAQGRRSAGPAAAARGPTLPVALTSFVGRHSELEEIAALARAHRLVTLTGAGGIGKTRTALCAASALKESDGRPAFFVGFAPIADPALVVPAIAAALGVQEAPHRPLLDSIVGYLDSKNALLVFDNCEHVIAAAATAAERILSACGQARILATSREPLKAGGERVYRLPSLGSQSALALFTDRARAVDHAFELTDNNARTVADICGRLDGIPLAIELAAARVSSLSLSMLAEKLGDRFRILTLSDRGALPRQQTMLATIDWSYNLLSGSERRVFDRLSIFAGGCTLDTAAAVCSDDAVGEDELLDVLSSLIDKSLVVVDHTRSEPRYVLLDTFRDYASEKLAASGELDAVARRHATAYRDLAERLDAAFDAGPDSAWRPQTIEELDNWRAALRWALAPSGDAVLGADLVGRLSIVWQNVAPLEAKPWLAKAFELANDAAPKIVVARLLHAQAVVALVFGNHQLALVSGERAIAEYRAAGDELGVARAQSLTGVALAFLGRTSEARPPLEEALACARALHNRNLAAFALRCLGNLSAAERDDAATRTYVTEAVRAYESIGAELAAARTKDDLSAHELRAGNIDVALAHAQDAVAALRRFNDMRHVANALGTIAVCLTAFGRFDEAEERAREQLALAREQGAAVIGAWALQHLAAIAALRERPEGDVSQCARASRILGFVDARLKALGSGRIGNLSGEYNRTLALVRDALGDVAVTKLMAEGAAMTEDEAAAAALWRS